mmetsp:Transcript_10569/g.19339  ORF Transcript_10569/g.19339 Transcript_10569/m.19339 type:complete len:273 (-) Transcript_10569:1109-1927(-)
MHPITAMATPGRCPVFWRIFSDTSWRLKRVLPQLGQETYSVLVLRMRLPWRSPKAVERRNSTSSWGAEMDTPSPSPSTRQPPTLAPVLITSSSRDVPAANSITCTTGSVTSLVLRNSNSRRARWRRLLGSLTLRRMTMGFRVRSTFRSLSVSVPSISIAYRTMPWGSSTCCCCFLAANSRRENLAIRPGITSPPCLEDDNNSLAGTMACKPMSWRRLSARRPALSAIPGALSRRMASLVATSLNGIPTASFAPRRLYVTSGSLVSSAKVTVE